MGFFSPENPPVSPFAKGGLNGCPLTKGGVRGDYFHCPLCRYATGVFHILILQMSPTLFPLKIYLRGMMLNIPPLSCALF
jgi:hypothetical protein